MQKYHQEDWHTPEGKLLRDVIFGLNDGLVTSIGFVSGVTGAVFQTKVIILTGIAQLAAGGVAMYIGAYLSNKSQQEFFYKEIAREKREIKEIPEVEKQEIRDIYDQMGFKRDEIEMIVNRITSDEKLWVRFMMREELGILEEEMENPMKAGMIMGGTFLAGGIFPLIPYFFFEDTLLALKTSILLSVFVFFMIGVGKSSLTKTNWFKSGMQVTLLGGLAALVGYLIGKGISFIL
ncbi:MAG: VIT1/CCC1 transporter family protein [Nitrospirae bacterium]|nr:VIT1/CCC1 transporter family protein [Nitrospirota bacterium]MBI3594701.1 VIT1/CCC1 transporter family protein [Nitrospirota bacterium]